MVKAFIEGSRCKIKFGNNYSEEFVATIGLQQVLSQVVRKVQETENSVKIEKCMHYLSSLTLII